MEKINLKDITAICIDGRDLSDFQILEYKKIFDHMMEVADFYDVIFVTKKDPEFKGVKFVYADLPLKGLYSTYCIKSLNSVIESKYCLVFQIDGFIINPHLWSDDFYSYDYIGAPWTSDLPWSTDENRVGNGGFSLRSKKFLEVSETLRETFENEDVYILFHNYNILKGNGIKIAPFNVAMNFAIENQCHENHTLDNSFGFHGIYHLNSVSEKIKVKK
jgi:hypothetical protein